MHTTMNFARRLTLCMFLLALQALTFVAPGLAAEPPRDLRLKQFAVMPNRDE